MKVELQTKKKAMGCAEGSARGASTSFESHRSGGHLTWPDT